MPAAGFAKEQSVVRAADIPAQYLFLHPGCFTAISSPPTKSRLYHFGRGGSVWSMRKTPPADILVALDRMGLLNGATPSGEPLAGGVSSDIWRIDLPSGPVCIKRALPKLRVSADWQAPVERNLYEARWMRIASQAVPGATPALLGQDETTGALAMSYLPGEQYPLWKALLRDGHVEPAFAAAVAWALCDIHAATAAQPSLAAVFPTDCIFYDIRLEPYLRQTGRA